MKKSVIIVIALFLVTAFSLASYGQADNESAIAVVQTTFKWEAMNGPMEGVISLVPEKGISNKTYTFTGNLSVRTFNAKVWKDGSSIPWLAIVTIAFDNNNKVVVTDESFRFDQATNERKERFCLVNATAQTLYFRIDNKEVMLKPGGKSMKIEAYMGWYYIEASRKTSNGEVVPFNVVIPVAERQKVIEIQKSNIPK